MFQHTAFQNSGFQTLIGASDTTPLGTTILDGANDAVGFLEQEAEYLTTLGDSLGQSPDGGDGTFYPTISSVSSGSLGAANVNHTVNLPTYVAGDSVYIFFGHSKANATVVQPTGWFIAQSPVSGDPSNGLAVIYRIMDGSEGATLTVATTASSEAVWTCYTIQGAQALEPPQVSIGAKVGTILNPAPPSVVSTWGSSKGLWFAGCHMVDSLVTGPEVAPSTYPFVQNNTFIGQAGVANFAGIATCNTLSTSTTVSPAAFTHANTTGGNPSGISFTVGIRGLNSDPPNPPQIVPDVYELGLELPDGEGFTQNGVRENNVPLDCFPPQISDVTTTVVGTGSVNHNVNLPANVGVGDILVIAFNFSASISTTAATPSGWSRGETRTQRYGGDIFYKVADGTEGGTTVNVVTTASATATAISFRVLRETVNFDVGSTVANQADQGASTTYDPPSVTYPGNETDQYLYVAIGAVGSTAGPDPVHSSYPAGYTDNQTTVSTAVGATGTLLDLSSTTGTSATADPGTGSTTVANSSAGITIIFRGRCGYVPIWTDQNPYEDYGWDDADYGTQSDVSLDFVPPDDPSSGSTVDDSEYLIDDADYGFEQDPVGDDADLAQSIWSDGNNVEDPTWTDTTDYSTQSDPLAGDVDLAQGIIEDGNTRDDTDYADYGTQTDPLADSVDLAQGIFDDGTNLEDPTFADWFEYGTQSDPLADDVDLGQSILDSGNNVEDATGADWFEYGTQTDPLAPDLPEDGAQGEIDDGNTVEDATYTDWAEYGTQTDVSFDFIDTTQEDFLLGIDSGNDQFDDPTQTDQSDYGTQSDPQIDDADLGQSIIDDGNNVEDPTYADWFEYGTQSDPQIGDADLGQSIIDSGTNLEDPTGADWFEYGTQTDPLSGDFPQDFLLGLDDGTTLEDPSYTDQTDYGTQTDPLADDVDLGQSIIEDGNTRDDTDYADYGTQSDPLAGDNDLPFQTRDDGTNLEDPTGADWFEYGTQSDPLSDNLPEDAILGIDDGTNLDDPTQTDTADYGTQSDILLFLQEDFNLGTGDGLDSQDFTDTADYGFTQDGISNMEGGFILVPVTGVSGTGGVGHVCPTIYADITDPSASYTPITDPTGSYTPITQGSATYTPVTDPSGSWDPIVDPAATWTKVDDC